jgi:hypothetical protein
MGHRGFEQLEDRRMLSAIVWTNRGADGFSLEQRSVVDAAIDAWERTIVDFNNDADDNTFSVEISLTDLSGISATALGISDMFTDDAAGIPISGRIRIDDDAAGGAWYVDPLAIDDAEFPTLQGTFQGNGGPAGTDMFTVVLHELGHVLGFADSYALFSTRVTAGPGPDRTFTGNGGFSVILTPVAEGPHVADIAGQTNELMNSLTPASGQRTLISDLTVRVLADAFNYTTILPSQINTFHANLDHATGVLTVNGSAGDVDDHIVIDNNGSLRVIVNGTEETFAGVTVTAINILAGDGDDFIFVSPDVGIATTIDPGNGNDRVYVGGGPTTVTSVVGDGDDLIDFSHNPLGVTFTVHGGDHVIGTRFNDTLIVDSTNGLITSPIYFDGGAGVDRVDLRQTGGPTRASSTVYIGPNAGQGRSVIVDGLETQIVDFQNIEPLTDNVAAVDFTITSVAGLASLLQGANEIEYSAGLLLADSGRVTVDNFEPIEFTNKENLTIDAGAGHDHVVLDNAELPTGLVNITVLGGNGEDVLTALNVPDASATTFLLVTLNGGAGADRLDASAIAVATSFLLQGGAQNDILIGGAGDDTYEGGTGDDLLISSLGDDTFDGGDGFDTILVEGRPLNDVIDVFQINPGTLAGDLYQIRRTVNGVTTTMFVQKTAPGDAPADAANRPTVEQVRIEAGEGNDTIRVGHADAYVDGDDTTGVPQQMLRFWVDGGPPNASDRLIVRDDGLGDLVLLRQAADGRSGRVTVNPVVNTALGDVVYEGIERVDITPIDPVTGGTGTGGGGRIVVFRDDPFELNDNRLTATDAALLPLTHVNPKIDPGSVLDAFGPDDHLPGDEDWYEFRPTKSSTFRVDVLFQTIATVGSGRPGLPGDGELEIAVYDANGVLIANGAAVADLGAQVLFGAEAGRRYFLRVKGAPLNGNSLAINNYTAAIVDADDAGPQVTGVFVTGFPTFDLFDPKPQIQGPTPLVNGLTINIQDLSPRALGFLYPALKTSAGGVINTGRFRLIGDANGAIQIATATFISDPIVAGQAATGRIELTFAEPLPDDRYTLTIRDILTDPAGNKLDGEVPLTGPGVTPTDPSGDGVAGGKFVMKFTVDSRPEIAVYAGRTVSVDANGNFTFDPRNTDATNRDLTFDFGLATDQRFAGKFGPASVFGTRFDVLAAYGRVNGKFRFLIDFNGNGRVNSGESIISPLQVNGLAVAGNFDGNAANGDEIAIFDGTRWHLDVFGATQVVDAGIRGYPLVGDFDGDGLDDLATYQKDRFFFNLAHDGFNDAADRSFRFGAPGVLDRAVAADMDGDGIDDVGVWWPHSGAQSIGGEWRFLISGDFDQTKRVTGQVNTLNHAFNPTPLGRDISAHFGDPRALPLVGNFDPPPTAAKSAAPLAAPLAAPAALVVSTQSKPPQPAAAAASKTVVPPTAPKAVTTKATDAVFTQVGQTTDKARDSLFTLYGSQPSSPWLNLFGWLEQLGQGAGTAAKKK